MARLLHEYHYNLDLARQLNAQWCKDIMTSLEIANLKGLDAANQAAERINRALEKRNIASRDPRNGNGTFEDVVQIINKKAQAV